VKRGYETFLLDTNLKLNAKNGQDYLLLAVYSLPIHIPALAKVIQLSASRVSHIAVETGSKTSNRLKQECGFPLF
jgi:hypothetical protein